MNKEKRKKLEEKGIVVTDTPYEFFGITDPEEIKQIEEKVENEILKRKQNKEEKRLLDRSRSRNKTST